MSRFDQVAEALRSKPRTWLVTGVAGFIGSHLLETLLRLDQYVVGLDNFAYRRPHLTRAEGRADSDDGAEECSA